MVKIQHRGILLTAICACPAPLEVQEPRTDVGIVATTGL